MGNRLIAIVLGQGKQNLAAVQVQYLANNGKQVVVMQYHEKTERGNIEHASAWQSHGGYF
jgi:hypothetical protein